MDDGTLGGNWQDVIEDLQQIEEAAGSLGLTLNHHKCEIICTDDGARDSMLAFSPSLQCVEPSEASLLGSPIGGPKSIDDVLSSKKATLELLGVRLKLLHSHNALCLLRNALAHIDPQDSVRPTHSSLFHLINLIRPGLFTEVSFRRHL